MKRRRNQRNKSGIEDNKDMLSNLPDCVLLHIMSLLNTKEAVRTCILSTRWKHLWRYLPTLTLSWRNFKTFKGFTKFVTQILSLRDASTALTALDFERFGRVERHLLNRIIRYAISHNVSHLRLSCCIEHLSPSLFSCLPLTSLDLADPSYSDRQIFPNSLNLPALTYLKLNNLSFCSGSDGRVEPFSTFNSLDTLILLNCRVLDAQQPLCISSTTLLNLSIHSYYQPYSNIDLFAPSLCTFYATCDSFQKLFGSHLSSIKKASLVTSRAMHPVEATVGMGILNWLIEMTGIESLTICPTTLQTLSLALDVLKLRFPSFCNLKSLQLNLSSYAHGFSLSSWRDIKMKLVGGKSWKENTMLREAVKAGLMPEYASSIDEMIELLLLNSPSAKVDVVTDSVVTTFVSTRL